MAGRKAGWRAPLWGGICGTIPDLDVIAGSFMHVVESNAFHRTITHSILFFVVMSPLLGYLIRRIHSGEKAGWRDWTLLAFWSLFTHALLDSFTTWGTALFWPLDYKVALQSVFVIDPFYTVPLLICLIVALTKPVGSRRRKRWNTTGLIISSLYLVLGLGLKYKADQVFMHSLKKKGIEARRMESRPSPMNIILWGATAETDHGYYTGYYSLLQEDDSVDFQYYPKQHELVSPYTSSKLVRKLTGLTEGWYTAESPGGDGILINDLRFGTNRAWEAGGSFIFSYKVHKDEDGTIRVSQQDRSFDESPGTIISKLIQRVVGKKE